MCDAWLLLDVCSAESSHVNQQHARVLQSAGRGRPRGPIFFDSRTELSHLVQALGLEPAAEVGFRTRAGSYVFFHSSQQLWQVQEHASFIGGGTAHDPFTLSYIRIQRATGRSTSDERVTKLLCAYGGLLQQQMRRVPQLLERRQGKVPVTLDASTGRKHVADIGSYFKVQGLTRTALELIPTLAKMDPHFLDTCNPLTGSCPIQLLRLVAAPGMGKSTALDLIWDELQQLVEQHEALLVELGASTLVSRVRNSLTQQRMLVFKMDCRSHDLAGPSPLEGLRGYNILAARLMYMVTHSRDSSKSYVDFLQDLDKVVPLVDLQPLDVLEFVRAASGLSPDEDALAVFAFDEADAVRKAEGHRLAWLPKALSAFVDLRLQASGHETFKLMPVAIVASTLASATTLDISHNGGSLVSYVRIWPLTAQQMWEVIRDLSQRLGHGQLGQVPGQELPTNPLHVSRVLEFVGGNPRHLAWAISGMSGGTAVDLPKQTLWLGQDKPCTWMHDPGAFKLPDVLGRLSDNLHGWEAWLSDHNKIVLVNQIVRHGLLGRPVSRDAVIDATGNYGGNASVCWQDAENAGVCMLVNHGAPAAAAPTAAANGSRLNSSTAAASGGWVVDEASTPAWLRERLVQDDDRDLYRVGFFLDRLVNQFVWLPPMLAVLAWRHHEAHPELPLAQPPLIRSFMNLFWEHEQTDVLMLALRLQLLNANGILYAAAPLSDLLPGALPTQLCTARVVLPAPGSILHPPVNLPSSVQSSDRRFQRLCKQSPYHGAFAFVESGNEGPNGWVVLQLVGRKPLVLLVRNKRGMQPGRLTAARVVAEADKCRNIKLRQLLVLVTDDPMDAADAELLTGLPTRVPVVVVGPSIHRQYYAQACAFVKCCLAVAQAHADRSP